MGDGITRRDFMDGFACAVVAGIAHPGLSRAEAVPAHYPPGRTGAGFYRNLKLDYPVSLGDYRFPVHPDEPMVLHLASCVVARWTVIDLRSSWRAGRALLFARRFGEFELHARDELTRILGPGGFDADRDIAAITVNRWGHGYAYEPVSLFDPPAMAREVELSSAHLGRIHFAGTDAAWVAYADRAIDSAHRVAGEILG